MKYLFAKIVNYLFYFPQWQVGVGLGSIETIIESGTLPSIKWWPKLRSTLFNADPFPLHDEVIYERMNRWRGRAEIWIAALDGSKQRPFLRASFHMSYPCVSVIQGRTFVIYESASNYDCKICELSNNSVDVISVINEPIVDPTLFYFNDKYWIFGSLPFNGEECKALRIWVSDTIEGPWRQHKRNPVKIDAASSRSAGNIVNTSIGLVRPSQDCSKSYGGSISFNRIDELNEDSYRETLIQKVSPQLPYGQGLHTINFSGQNTVIVDGKTTVFHPLALYLRWLSTPFPKKPKDRKTL